jgi:hypothetical protein
LREKTGGSQALSWEIAQRRIHHACRPASSAFASVNSCARYHAQSLSLDGPPSESRTRPQAGMSAFRPTLRAASTISAEPIPRSLPSCFRMKPIRTTGRGSPGGIRLWLAACSASANKAIACTSETYIVREPRFADLRTGKDRHALRDYIRGARTGPVRRSSRSNLMRRSLCRASMAGGWT